MEQLLRRLRRDSCICGRHCLFPEPTLINRLARTLNNALLACVFALGAAPAAHAAYVVIKADPAFGPAFPNLGWRAIGAIFVPDSCLSDLPESANAAVFQPAAGTPCADIRMQDVKVGFYDLSDPNTIIEELLIGTYLADTDPPPDGADKLTQVMTNISFDDNDMVDGFDTSLSFAVHASSLIAGGGANYFSLEFGSTGSRLVAFGEHGHTLYSQKVAESINPPTISISAYIEDGNYKAPTFITRVSTVPEPGSLGLAGLALAGMGLALRRRRTSI